ncbi:hypothetical protein [Limnobacter sp.]|uniref:hypothetical protein n=1 Tax=Limnobacter sp. TaxID=2003368 RepID=UPI002FDF6C12
MSIPEPMQVVWWKWWSNPLINIHADQLERLPFETNRETNKALDYFQLLQTRSILELDDIPEPSLQDKPELISISLADSATVERHLLKLATLTMDTSIIHARPQEWNSKFGISSPEEIRQIIEHYRSIPYRLSKWQFSVASLVNHNDNMMLPTHTRTQLGLGLVIKSFFPSFFQRWSITSSRSVTSLIKQIDPLEEGLWNETIGWIDAELAALFEETANQYREPALGIEHDLLTDEFSPLDIEAIYRGANV